MAVEVIRAGKDRGAGAYSPHQIPPRGWKDVSKRLIQSTMEDRVMLISAGVTYYTLLALVPSLAVFVSIYGLFNDRATVNQHIGLLSGIMPAGGVGIIKDQLDRLTATGTGALSLTLILSLLVALWSASAGIKSLFEAMNIAYREREKRNFFVLNVMALGFTLASVVAAFVFVTVVVVIPIVLNALYLGKGFEWLISVSSYALMAILLLSGISTLYRWGPSREQARWRWISPGAVFSVLAIGAVSVLFSWYAANFSNYNATYGSLGALVGLLTWIWISITLLIMGAELNSELEYQTARDSTTGPPEPMGERGAYMADHVAPSDPVPSQRKSGKADRLLALGLLATILLASARRRP